MQDHSYLCFDRYVVVKMKSIVCMFESVDVNACWEKAKMLSELN